MTPSSILADIRRIAEKCRDLENRTSPQGRLYGSYARILEASAKRLQRALRQAERAPPGKR